MHHNPLKIWRTGIFYSHTAPFRKFGPKATANQPADINGHAGIVMTLLNLQFPLNQLGGDLGVDGGLSRAG